MFIKKVHFSSVNCVLLSSICISLSSKALADITQVRAIDFGEIAIINNDVVSTLSIDFIGNVSFDNAIRIIRPGEPGQYLVTGFAGNVELNITTQILGGVMNPGQVSAEYPNLVALSAPTTIRTESDGTAIINVGGSIQTSGSGNNGFVDAVYTTNLRVTINF